MTITNKDVEKLKEVFATKDDHREIMTTLDKVMDELVKAREDRMLAIGKDREQDRRLDRLEAKVG
ncbi:hypothetical protein A3K48_04815 [candidate division WOR-1 bacterium RIFOXYA12_FULL_52_29]|uniref:Uncharacterized protein n=1 Tax=candidate division WOR-1 bacterium RIFOXYC12_FULL_54_18 TaxID=1802584 RepID=A0A1F4T6R1_UNCSA|nr:MAG: hypothetical protein A3K44_04815 [candidate division WOR-1 bacterium RIFOXYA2_FULL_51_19]OGC17869.1 MAG: hypothetical protein A3K48_04815 [candidate division WOR-1 bacterium RIFOXYA12_FULL_52_29]OGC26726.1 MAG: hypothetical protein A3K32_04810 [candidate division WOR-1 bacterium RIFOXYB2_FULL_45_9]OGC28286.1 MAG: hypothetical protein A3K49_04815 [candidate division WOR-1 bacterium RIFOXYC12_FULL_54_18]OGC31256.1 MAG: hypothetical protein A2346_07805 [candidate division WOR-1 bacterium R